NGIHDAENRGVGSNSDGERQNRDGGEARILPQHPKSIAQILPDEWQHIFLFWHSSSFRDWTNDAPAVRKERSATILFPCMEALKALIREIPDFPKPGIQFYDITTLLKDPKGFKAVIDSLAAQYKSTPIDVVLGIEARGFIIAPAVAYALGY